MTQLTTSPGTPRQEEEWTEGVVEFDLAIRVERALNATGYGALRAVKVSVQAGVVLLAGRVPTYHLKQVAQQAVQSVSKMHQVRNDLDVVRPS